MYVDPRDNVSVLQLLFPPGSSPYYDPYGEASPERETFFS